MVVVDCVRRLVQVKVLVVLRIGTASKIDFDEIIHLEVGVKAVEFVIGLLCCITNFVVDVRHGRVRHCGQCPATGGQRD